MNKNFPVASIETIIKYLKKIYQNFNMDSRLKVSPERRHDSVSYTPALTSRMVFTEIPDSGRTSPGLTSVAMNNPNLASAAWGRDDDFRTDTRHSSVSVANERSDTKQSTDKTDGGKTYSSVVKTGNERSDTRQGGVKTANGRSDAMQGGIKTGNGRSSIGQSAVGMNTGRLTTTAKPATSVHDTIDLANIGRQSVLDEHNDRLTRAYITSRMAFHHHISIDANKVSPRPSPIEEEKDDNEEGYDFETVRSQLGLKHITHYTFEELCKQDAHERVETIKAMACPIKSKKYLR